MEELAYELNREGARLAREAAAHRRENEDGQPRFVAGALGPTNRTASISPDVNNPGFRAVTFDELREAYAEQVRGPARRRRRPAADRDDLRHAQRQGGDLRHRRDLRGARRRRAGDDLRHHHRPLRPHCCPARRRRRSGIRCATPRRSRSGSTARSAPRRCARISPSSRRVADTLVCAYPNAGLPNEFGLYDESPEFMAGLLGEFAERRPRQHRRRLLRHHARRISAPSREAVAGKTPRAIPEIAAACCGCRASSRSRSRRKFPFVNVGERTNVTGSAQVPQADHRRRLHRRARGRARPGRERRADHRRQHGRGPARFRSRRWSTFLNLIASEPDIARVPVMIDSSKFSRDRGRPEMRAGQAGREFDLDEGRRGGVHRARQDRAPLRRRRRRDGVRRDRARPTRSSARSTICAARLRHPGRAGRLPAGRHHLRSRTSSRSRPASRSTTTTASTSSRRRAGSGRTCRTRMSRAASRTSRSRSAATSRCARRCTRCSSITPSRPAWTWASSMPAQMAVYDDLDPELREALRGRGAQPPRRCVRAAAGARRALSAARRSEAKEVDLAWRELAGRASGCRMRWCTASPISSRRHRGGAARRPSARST